MFIETVIEDQRWSRLDLAAIAERAARATISHLGLRGAFEFIVLGCDDARIAVLNKEFRGKASPTNVLSWPSVDRASKAPGRTPRLPRVGTRAELGDIAIAYETCAREAKAARLSITDHATHLMVHALLHLLGYDHELEADAALMERIETEILARLGVADPY